MLPRRSPRHPSPPPPRVRLSARSGGMILATIAGGLMALLHGSEPAPTPAKAAMADTATVVVSR